MNDPNRSRRRFLVLSMVVLVPLVAGVLLNAARPTEKEPGGDALYKYLSIFSETLNLVRQNYVEPTDPGTLLAGAMEGSTDALDPYSIFLPANVTREEEASVSPGARHAGLVVLKERGVAFAAAVEEGSAAAKAGLETGDILSLVAGHPTRQMPLWAINHELSVADAAAAGSTLELEIVRDGETKKLQLGTEPSAAGLVPRLEEKGGFPVLVVPRLDAAAVAAARPLLEELTAAGKKQLIVDLRGLNGADPDVAYAFAGLFARGPLGTLREKGKEAPLKSFASDVPPAWSGEMVVMVNGYTAGAAEIVAAALRKSAGAKLVGTPSFGWAGERSRIELSNGSRLLLTTAYFSAADNEAISKSLAPDLLVDDDGRRFEERDRPLSELILDRAIRFLSGDRELGEKKAA